MGLQCSKALRFTPPKVFIWSGSGNNQLHTSAGLGRNGIETFIFFRYQPNLKKRQRKCSQYGRRLEQPAQNSILFGETRGERPEGVAPHDFTPLRGLTARDNK
jgi:hypothetical protein